MKTEQRNRLKHLRALGLLACSLGLAGSSHAQTTGQWDFNSGDLTATSGAILGDLTYADGPTGQTAATTTFANTSALGIPAIGGTNAAVMGFSSGSLSLNQGYFMPTPANNGGGSLVNNYTLICDVLYTNSGTLRPIVQMDDGTLDHIKALIQIDANNVLQITNTSGSSLASGAFGTISPNTWYRLGFVVDTTHGKASVYTNGVQVGTLSIGTTLDSAYALLASSVLPVFSSTITNSPGFANSIQLRDEVLSSGQMAALGSATAAGVPLSLPPAYSFIDSRSPDIGSTGAAPLPAIHIAVDKGSTTINPASVSLSVDGSALNTTVTAGTTNQINVDAAITSILDPLSTHTLRLVYSDSLLGARTNTWSFTVANYQNITLPTPLYFENFDELTEGTLPTGWVVTNATRLQISGFDLNAPTSESYMDFVVISSNRLSTVFNETGSWSSPDLGAATGNRRLVIPPIVLNGVLIDSLVHGNFAYADSDQRSNTGGQVNVMFTCDYNLTGKTNIYLAFNSIYEQNQDNIGSVEYSIDQGVTWLPALYMLDDGTTDADGSDIVTNSTGIDVFATFGTARSDQAWKTNYGSFIGATVSSSLIASLSGRRNDDPISSKRIEVIRLPMADNQAHVRVRFGQAGTSSWYFGIDDFGLYSITTPVIKTQPVSQNTDAGTAVTFSVVATGSPLTYQWRFNGFNIPNATNSSYTLASVSPTNAGSYKVMVGGVTLSSPAVLTVNTTPIITTDLVGEMVDPGSTLILNTLGTGGRPLTYKWYQNGSQISSGSSSSLTLNNMQAANTGSYQLVLANNYGSVTGLVAQVRLFNGALSSNLVVHLNFDGSLTDSSGRGNDATYATYGLSSSPTPRFTSGFLGQAFEYTTIEDHSVTEYATLGYPSDLQFGETNDFSVSMWVNYTNQTDDLPFISNKDWDSSSNLGWGIFTQTGGNYRINVTGLNRGTDKFSQTDTPTVLKDGNWHNIVVSIQRAPYGQKAYIYGYLDGVLVTKHANNVALTTDTYGTAFSNHQGITSSQVAWAVNIGQDGTGVYSDGGSAHDIDAKIDDLGIWRRALTANEAAGIYKAGLAGTDLSLAVAPSILVYSVVGGNMQFTWAGKPTLKLQKATSLNPANWADVTNTLGASSATVPVTGGSAFFRLAQ